MTSPQVVMPDPDRPVMPDLIGHLLPSWNIPALKLEMMA